MDWDDLSWKLKDIKDKAQEVASNALDRAMPIVAEVVGTVIDVTRETAEATIEKATEVAAKVTDMAADIQKQTKKGTIMEHRVLMMGGRRSGKSSILSSILYALDGDTPGSVCTVIDQTDKTQMVTDPTGKVMPIPSLKSKRKEIKKYIKEHKQQNAANQYANFLIDMTPTYGAANYKLHVTATQNPTSAQLDLYFDDVPGEWMEDGSQFNSELQKMIAAADVFIIAIDTPFLMETDADTNTVYNRIDEITSALTANVKTANEHDRKQIIFCPVKCERWTNNGQAELVTERVCQAYKTLINTWVKHPQVYFWVMPINTAGCVESAELLPAMLYFKKDAEDAMGTQCSVDDLTGIIYDKEGNTLSIDNVDRVEHDEAYTIDYVDIPLSWYHCNGKEFSTRFCEQPAYHILKFLVEKEENVIAQKAEAQRRDLDKKNAIVRWFYEIFNPTFGQYLPVWKGVIDGLNSSGKIKNEGDGFKRITDFVE